MWSSFFFTLIKVCIDSISIYFFSLENNQTSSLQIFFLPSLVPPFLCNPNYKIGRSSHCIIYISCLVHSKPIMEKKKKPEKPESEFLWNIFGRIIYCHNFLFVSTIPRSCYVLILGFLASGCHKQPLYGRSEKKNMDENGSFLPLGIKPQHSSFCFGI